VERLLGYRPEELVGKTVPELNLLAVDSMLPALEDIKRVLDGERVNATEYTFLAKDGSIRQGEVSGAPLIRDGEVVAVVSVARDISDRKNLEAQLHQAQKMEAIGLLAGGIAHDFNNLLTAINGYAELVMSKLVKDDPLQDMVEKILQSGQRAAALTGQLLTFSRKRLVEPEILDINQVITHIGTMLKRIIGEHIKIDTALGAGLWPIQADRSQIEQVIINLAVNSRDAMPDGGKLSISTQNVTLDQGLSESRFHLAQGDYVVIEVGDTGIGMSQEIIDHLFEPFFTTKEAGKGTGLGLASVYGIVKQARGGITISSQPEQGTVFRIYFPRSRSVPMEQSVTVEGEAHSASGETILLVEDDKNVREMVRQMLLSLGYTLLEADNGPEALQLAATYAGPIHLLLTDVIMPGMSGRILATQLIRSRPEVKVLFMSGYTGEEVLRHGIQSEQRSFLKKPFKVAALKKAIREALQT
jgi:PAS domain S-box-containing protein